MILPAVDVSDYQGEIAWDQALDHVNAVVVQVGYATKYGEASTKTGARNIASTRGRTLVGAYFFGYPVIGPYAAIQGQRAADMAMTAGWRPASDLPLALDIEVNPMAMEPAAMSDWIDAWLQGTGIDPKHLAGLITGAARLGANGGLKGGRAVTQVPSGEGVCRGVDW